MVVEDRELCKRVEKRLRTFLKCRRIGPGYGTAKRLFIHDFGRLIPEEAISAEKTEKLWEIIFEELTGLYLEAPRLKAIRKELIESKKIYDRLGFLEFHLECCCEQGLQAVLWSLARLKYVLEYSEPWRKKEILSRVRQSAWLARPLPAMRNNKEQRTQLVTAIRNGIRHVDARLADNFARHYCELELLLREYRRNVEALLRVSMSGSEGFVNVFNKIQYLSQLCAEMLRSVVPLRMASKLLSDFGHLQIESQAARTTRA
ncbi:MAG: hypothetical protein HY706_00720 [Candidatus Hydrogenedentes bacterium]|nr:hypothetical protein [Candidatus Hydrogenedentota bacterium]